MDTQCIWLFTVNHFSINHGEGDATKDHASADFNARAPKTVTSLSLSIALSDHSFLNTLRKSAFGTHLTLKHEEGNSDYDNGGGG